LTFALDLYPNSENVNSLVDVLLIIMAYTESMKIVIIPGNGAGAVESSIWYAWVREALRSECRVNDVILRDMPDPVLARECYWLPFMRDELVCDRKTIIVGHSSGAAAAMRYAEQWPVAGLVLVGAYSSDLDDETEQQSGYFSRPWEWDLIRRNSPFVIQFGSTDDPYLPWHEQKSVADALGADLRQFSNRGHFTDNIFPELVMAVMEVLKLCKPV